MLFVVIERFRNGDPKPVYARFAERGRMAPDGVRYINSWTTSDLRVCYQVMECETRVQLDAWMANWSDPVEFDVQRVMTSPEAARAVADLPGRSVP